jgi:hypothetical protein
VLLHDVKELHDDLGRGSDENLSLSGLLGVVDGVQAVIEDGGLDHFGGIEGICSQISGQSAGAILSVRLSFLKQSRTRKGKTDSKSSRLTCRKRCRLTGSLGGRIRRRRS